MTECKEVGCHKPVKTRGWCSMHYGRWLKYGDPNFVKHLRAPGTPEERFWAHVDRTAGEDGCHPWRGSINWRGYGQVNDSDGHHTFAHRVAYKLEVGDIPTGWQIDHTCHDPDICDLGGECPHRRCCNPKHLEAVPAIENHRRRRHSNLSERRLRARARRDARANT